MDLWKKQKLWQEKYSFPCAIGQGNASINVMATRIHYLWNNPKTRNCLQVFIVHVQDQYMMQEYGEIQVYDIMKGNRTGCVMIGYQ